MTYSTELLTAAALLDEDAPGWHRKINLETFTLASPCLCVVGQTYGIEDFSAGNNDPGGDMIGHMDRLLGEFGDCETPVRRAFYTRSGLEDEWKEFIQARQAADREITLTESEAERTEMIEGVPC